jgi:membrane protease YdiL (CAAX protease family)
MEVDMTSVGRSQGFRWGSFGSGKREQLVEVAVFLFLILPSLALSFFAVKQGDVSFVLTAVATILRDLGLVGLILFFIWRNGERLTSIGWTLRHRWRDVGLGILLFIPMFFGAAFLERALQAAGFSVPSTPTPSALTAKGIGEYVLAFFLVVVVAVAEETIFRGYLILRFKAVTASTILAVLLAAIVFSLGHGYEGTAGVVTVGTMGLVFALVYIWRGSLVAPVVMHFLQDFVSIILLPMLQGG